MLWTRTSSIASSARCMRGSNSSSVRLFASASRRASRIDGAPAEERSHRPAWPGNAMKLQLVGGGRMGEALLSGLIAAGWADPADLGVVEKLGDRRQALEAQFPGVAVLPEPAKSDGAVIAVKPGDVAAACAAVADAGCNRVLSIAAGVPLARLQSALGGGVAVVRA